MLRFEDFDGAQRILIVGESGSGKTTLALKLGEKFGLPVFHCDDTLYIKKFSLMRNRKEAIRLMDDIYAGDRWIVEGTTRDLLKQGIERADQVVYLSFHSIFGQYTSLIKRYLKDRDSSLWELLDLLVYVTNKRFRITKKMSTNPLIEMARENTNLNIQYYPVSIE